MKLNDELSNKYKNKHEIRLLQKAKAYSHNIIGLIYADEGNYPEALNHHLTSLKIEEAINEIGDIAVSYNNIGNIYDKGELFINTFTAIYSLVFRLSINIRNFGINL